MLKRISRAILGIGIVAGIVMANDEGIWFAGLRTQGVVDFVPGNHFIEGPELGYSNFDFGGHRLQFHAAYLTNRSEQVFRKNLLKVDYYLFSPEYHFGRNSLFDLLLKMDLGYYHYAIPDSRFDALNNSSWIAAPKVGLGLNLKQGQFGIDYHLGYNLIVPQSGFVYPLVFDIGIWMVL